MRAYKNILGSNGTKINGNTVGSEPDIDLAEKIIRLSDNSGADESECFIQWGRGCGVSIEGNEIKQASGGSGAGFGLRVLKEGRVGFAYSSSFNNIPSVVEKALSLSRISPQLDRHFPDAASHYPKVSCQYDERLEVLEVTDLMDIISKMKDALADKAPSAMVTRGGIGFGVESFVIANSGGIVFEERGTGIYASISCIFDNLGISTGSSSQESTALDINGTVIGAEAANLALMGQGAKDGPSGEMEVLFVNEAAWEIFENVVIPAFNGSQTMEGKTYLHGLMEEMIAPEGFSLYDFPLMKGGLSCSPSDDEGVPSITIPLIENGAATSLLFDCFSAQKYDTNKTSSGIRAEGMGGSSSYKTPPATSARNIIVRGNEEKELGHMIEEMDRGIVVYDVLGAHTANRVSGDFSVNSSQLFYVDKGEIKNPISSAMISGNALELLEGINCIGTDVKKMSGGMGSASAAFPSMRIGNLRVTGS
jgi:PmbA protein